MDRPIPRSFSPPCEPAPTNFFIRRSKKSADCAGTHSECGEARTAPTSAAARSSVFYRPKAAAARRRSPATSPGNCKTQTRKNVLLADLDLISGLVGFLMKTPSSYSILDAIKNLSRLDESLWQAPWLLNIGPISPSFPAPASYSRWDHPDDDQIKQVLAVHAQTARMDCSRPRTQPELHRYSRSWMRSISFSSSRLSKWWRCTA